VAEEPAAQPEPVIVEEVEETQVEERMALCHLLVIISFCILFYFIFCFISYFILIISIISYFVNWAPVSSVFAIVLVAVLSHSRSNEEVDCKSSTKTTTGTQFLQGILLFIHSEHYDFILSIFFFLFFALICCFISVIYLFFRFSRYLLFILSHCLAVEAANAERGQFYAVGHDTGDDRGIGSTPGM
jgi:hypothetical protein